MLCSFNLVFCNDSTPKLNGFLEKKPKTMLIAVTIAETGHDERWDIEQAQNCEEAF